MPSRIKLEISLNDDGTLSLFINTLNESAEVRMNRNLRLDFKRTKSDLGKKRLIDTSINTIRKDE